MKRRMEIQTFSRIGKNIQYKIKMDLVSWLIIIIADI